ncbi:MAG: hypothetical protein PHY39_07590 [Endomicrobiaceae bacterium]|nr:hypothetical protein [Endomicrobiaceae bacterium]
MLKYLIVKLIFFIFLFIIWQIIGYIIRIYSNSVITRDYVKFTFIYFNIMLIFLLTIMPCNIKEHAGFFYLANTASLVQTIMFEPYIMEYFRIFSMMLFPCLSGIVIGQLIIISLIIGYILTKFNYYFKSSKIVYAMYIPFLMFLVIQNNLFMDTCIIYSYIILLLIFKLFFIKIDNREITTQDIIIITLITSILGTLRAEGIIFIALVPIIFIIINYHKYKAKQIGLFFLSLIIMTFIFIPKYIDVSFISKQEDKYEGIYKKLYIMDYSFKVLLKEAVNRNDKDIISEFTPDFDMKYLLADSTKIGMPLYVNLSEEHRHQFDVIAEKLMEKYQKTYIIYKLQDSFLRSYNHQIYKIGVEKINFKDNKGARKAYNKIDDKLILYCNDTRNYFADLFKKHATSKGSLLIPLSIVCSIILISLLFMKKTLFLISSLILVHAVSVSLLAPYGAFRYYFYFYIYGYLTITIFILSVIYNLTAEKKFEVFI